jgi:predicted enzyme related to lactoylglutathione lyase
MPSTEVSSEPASRPQSDRVAMRLEVVVVPVADVDRAKSFYYERLAWRLDAEVDAGDFRLLQLTPPGSTASVMIGQGVSTAEPGSIDRLLLAVEDIDAAREELIAHGVDVGEVFHHAGGSLGGGWFLDPAARAAGPDPEGRSYATYALFSDPDGNRWMLQEITERLPGRV